MVLGVGICYGCEWVWGLIGRQLNWFLEARKSSKRERGLNVLCRSLDLKSISILLRTMHEWLAVRFSHCCNDLITILDACLFR